MISSVGQGASVTIQVTVEQNRARGRIEGGQVEKDKNARDNVVEGGEYQSRVKGGGVCPGPRQP